MSGSPGLVGKTLGHYRIESLIGEGGMGVVYLALDTKLERRVAIKVLRPETVFDPDRKRRFVREAKAASALNHPNIVTIHDIAECDGMDYIVMELAAGRTLTSRLAAESKALALDGGKEGKALAPAQALHFGLQVADALARAHAAGIVHRDIKPDNLMVSDEDRVKVLDFGLAKLIDRSEFPSAAPGVFDPDGDGTMLGAVLGTAEYMSPEQAAGQRADARSDIFALGAVLYEMLSGRRAFDGPTKWEAMQKILRAEPPPLPATVPVAVEKIVRRCLAKDPKSRFQKMDDVRREMEKQTHAMSQAGARAATRKWLIAAAAALAVLLVAAGVNQFRETWKKLHRPRMNIIPITTFPGQEVEPALSPDGTRVAFLWDGDDGGPLNLYVKPVEGGDVLRLTHSDRNESLPAWSGDGKQIAFMRHKPDGPVSDVLLISSTGGEARPVGTSSQALDWSPVSNQLVIDRITPDKGLWMLDLSTGSLRRLTTPSAEIVTDRTPKFSPDGRQIAFTRLLHAGAYLCVVPADGGETRQVFFEKRGVMGLDWTSDGEELVYSWPSLSAQPSMYRIPVTGGVPEQVLSQAYNPSVARHADRLAFQEMIHNQNIWRMDVASIRNPGSKQNLSQSPARPKPLISSSQVNTDMRFSADGTKIVYASTRTGDSEIWIADSDGQHETRLTTSTGPGVGSPALSPDGKYVAYDSAANLFLVPAAGGLTRQLTSDGANTMVNMVPAWSRDSRWVFFTSNRRGPLEIWKTPVDGPAGTEPVQITHQGAFEAKVSADGETLYYAKRGQGDTELWSVPANGGAETPVSIPATILRRQWDVAREGFFFVRKDDQMICLWEFKSRRVIPLFTLEKKIGSVTRNFAASPDGRWVVWAPLDIDSKDINVLDHFR